MAELGQLLGTLLASLAHARRIADEETTMIAEHYKDNPLLAGMSLPRVRVPEMTLEFPVLIESHEAGESNVAGDTDGIVNGVVSELKVSVEENNATINKEFIDIFTRLLNRNIERLKTFHEGSERFPRELVVRTVDQTFQRLRKEFAELGNRPQQSEAISYDLRHKAAQVALKKSGKPPIIHASIITSEVKENAAKNNVSRIKLVLKEEGLEWSVAENNDGSHSRTLTPE